jgi:hypothetical protein
MIIEGKTIELSAREEALLINLVADTYNIPTAFAKEVISWIVVASAVKTTVAIWLRNWELGVFAEQEPNFDPNMPVYQTSDEIINVQI